MVIRCDLVTATVFNRRPINPIAGSEAYLVLGGTTLSICTEDFVSVDMSIKFSIRLDQYCQQCFEIPAGHKDGFHKRYLHYCLSATMCGAGHPSLQLTPPSCRDEARLATEGCRDRRNVSTTRWSGRQGLSVDVPPVVG